MSRFALHAVLLAAIYLGVLASTDPLDLLTGLALAVLVLTAAGQRPRGGPPATELARRLLAFVPYVLRVLADAAAGTWDVALIVLGLRPDRTAGIVELPVGERSPAGIVAFTVATTLTPGELLVDIDHERGVILLHVIDADDPDGVRSRHERGWERQRRVFP